ncbi:MAG: dynamin family protein [bacterium]|nr:dynamin family protein [bacterium]
MKPAPLAERQAALRRAIDLAEGRISPVALRQAAATLDRLGERAEIAPDRTVVALLGATGSGKSSLLNALVGEELARTAATRPTTREPLGVSWGSGASELLDWLQVPERAERPDDGSGLVLVDLPDIDSTEARHREIASRMSEAVDVLVWVLDPQKYADAVVHQQFLRPLSANADVTLVVLNQIDRLDGAAREQVRADLGRLLEADGLGGVQVLGTSARTGEGVAELREHLGEVARGKRARFERAAGDTTRAAEAVREAAEGAPEVGAAVSGEARNRLVVAAANAAGVPAVQDAVAADYVRRARAQVGWVPVRWLSKLRANPLKRLHLDRAPALPGTGRSAHQTGVVQEAAVRAAAHELVAAATRDLPDGWRVAAAEAAHGRIAGAVDGLDARIADTDLERGRRPGWWGVFGVLQWAAFLAAVSGALWLGVLALLGYLRMPAPGTPMVGEFPLPTVLLLGGVVLGILLAVLGMAFARVGSRRTAARVGKRLRAAVAAGVEERLIVPLESELEDYHLFRDSLGLALRS